VTVKVEGLKELRRNLKRVDAGLSKELRVANLEAAKEVVREARPDVPVRSGRLARSLRANATQSDARVKAGSAAVPYGSTIHFGRLIGNVGSPPGNHKGPNLVAGRPFITDAVHDSKGRIVDVYQARIDSLLRRTT
jgi:hypothetical protein